MAVGVVIAMSWYSMRSMSGNQYSDLSSGCNGQRNIALQTSMASQFSTLCRLAQFLCTVLD